MVELDPQLEEQLAGLSDEDYRSLTARVRQPTSSQRLREAAAKLINGDRLEAFMSVANVKAFADESGDVDEAKVAAHLSTLFDLPMAPQWQNFGQYAQSPPYPGLGERGRAEAQRRFGGRDTGSQPVRGSGGAAEAARRFGTREG